MTLYSLKYSNFSVILRFGPEPQILVCAMGQCTGFDYILLYEPVCMIWLHTMDHSAKGFKEDMNCVPCVSTSIGLGSVSLCMWQRWSSLIYFGVR
jgi:hypothetical protein